MMPATVVRDNGFDAGRIAHLAATVRSAKLAVLSGELSASEGLGLVDSELNSILRENGGLPPGQDTYGASSPAPAALPCPTY